MPFNAVKDKTETGPNASILAAATGDYNHGLSWNGGEKYNVVSYVGKGAFALVFKLSAKKDGEVYACKQIEKRRFIKDGILNHKVHNEILVMKDLEHVWINLPCKRVITDSNSPISSSTSNITRPKSTFSSSWNLLVVVTLAPIQTMAPQCLNICVRSWLPR